MPIETDVRKLNVNGDWGEWSEWSKCSRECNGGIQFIQRRCNNPVTVNQGRYCLGERKRYKVCNTEPCINNPYYDEHFKNEQCVRHNGNSAKNKGANWKFHLFERNYELYFLY